MQNVVTSAYQQLLPEAPNREHLRGSAQAFCHGAIATHAERSHGLHRLVPSSALYQRHAILMEKEHTFNPLRNKTGLDPQTCTGIGVLFGCIGGKIHGPGLPGGLIIDQGHLFAVKGQLCAQAPLPRT